MKLSDGTEYFKKPPNGSMVADRGKSQRWLDDGGNEWEPVKIMGSKGLNGMWWRMKNK